MATKGQPEETSGGEVPRTLWTYGYEITPSQSENLIKEIGALLSEEHENAKRTGQLWTGRMVLEQRVTHLMVVTDSPDQTGRVNHRIESRLEGLKAGYSLSAPMAITDDEPAQPPAPELSSGQDP